ncbi:MAG TPA: hypothetical protein VEQ63_03950, partial [Bryobacteraceae bacterium]|nr:hypothetical protein [Bryobacteraceae bacterium]
FPTSARLLLAGYAFASCAYSLYFKRLLFLDVMTLATFYTVRVLFGGIISDITVSVWAQAFFIFLFLSLAMAKRVAELKMTLHLGKEAPAGRCYYVSDLSQLQSFGGSSGYIAVLVLALYIQSPEVRIQYAHPEFLWAICLLLLYWIGRLWILINRGFLPDDPIAFAARDRASIGVFAACVLVIAFAKL